MSLEREFQLQQEVRELRQQLDISENKIDRLEWENKGIAEWRDIALEREKQIESLKASVYGLYELERQLALWKEAAAEKNLVIERLKVRADEADDLRQQLAERDEQISDLTISSDTYFAERNSARDVWRRASKDRDELRRQLAESKEEYGRACHLVAQMHAAAVGEVTGPKLGVVEDVAEVRQQLTDLTQTSFDLCPECGWRTLIPGEGCLKCATPDPKGAMEISMKQAFGATVRDRYDAEIAELRQQLADRDKQVMLLHFELFNSAEYIDTLGGTSLEARKTLAATEQWK